MHRPGIDPTDSSRLDSQCTRMLERLKAGPATNIELNAISLKYTSRISDLRKLGHDIPEPEKRTNGVTVYRLMPPKVERPAEQLSMFGGAV